MLINEHRLKGLQPLGGGAAVGGVVVQRGSWFKLDRQIVRVLKHFLINLVAI